MSVQSGAADVFISYAREDVAVAEQLARVLGDRGWAVWWDRDLIAGREFDRVIEEQLHAARAVIVLWSEASLESRWVRSEASAAADRGVLVPVMIAEVTTPIEFRNILAVVLRGWKGQADHPGIDGLDRALRILAGEPGGRGEGLPPPATRPQPERSPTRRWRWAAIAGAAVVVVLAIIVAVLLAGGDGKEQAVSTGTVTPAQTIESTAVSIVGSTVETTVETTIDEPRRVTVLGTTAWTDTSLDVRSGDLIEIDAAGTITHSTGGRPVGPDGDSDVDLRSFNVAGAGEVNHAAMIGRIGETETPFFVGSAYRSRAQNSGRLFLGINDVIVADNSGEFAVTISVSHP